jgi:guanylate kinase
MSSMSSPDEKKSQLNSGSLIGIVGPCGAGKTTLAQGLKRNGYEARAIVQEHSFVQDMWQRITKPRILIFLQASCAVGGERRQMKWTEPEWEEQQRRLTHSREHADYYLNTDFLSIDAVLTRVLEYLHERGPD